MKPNTAYLVSTEKEVVIKLLKQHMKEIYGRLLHVYLINFTYDAEDFVDGAQHYDNYKGEKLLEKTAQELDEEAELDQEIKVQLQEGLSVGKFSR